MVSEDSGGGADTDPRERKRQRDKQNQREKRRRERDVVDELKRRNDSLERQVKILRDGSDKVVQHLSDTVQQLHARNEVLVKKLSRVNAFIKSWTENDLGDGQIDEVGHDGGPLRSRDLEPVNNHPLPTSSNYFRPLLPSCDVQLYTDNVNAPVNEVPPDARSSPEVDQHMHHSTMSETTIPEPLVFPMPEFSTAGGYSMTNGESAQIPLTVERSILAPSRTQAGAFDLTIPIGKLQETVNMPVWERFPLCLDVPGLWNPFGSVIEEMRRSSKRFELCTEKPEVLHLLLGNSNNELANGVYQFTSRMPSRGTERCAINWMCYMLSRWIIDSSEDSFNRIPSIFRPTISQLFVPHPPVFDYILWPELRDNFIKFGMKYCRSEVFDLLFSSYRIQDPPAFVVSRLGAIPQIDPDFLERISKIDGWALLDKFWTEYPELVKGLDPLKLMVLEKEAV